MDKQTKRLLLFILLVMIIIIVIGLGLSVILKNWDYVQQRGRLTP